MNRQDVEGAVSDRLYFAQVREDPTLEIEALEPKPGETLVVVGSGGCTALSLVAAGAGRVVCVDVNRTQNHLIELKATAVASLDAESAIAFLGGAPTASDTRLVTYRALRATLSPAARTHWDRHPGMIARGVLQSGVSERFIAAIASAIRCGVHSRARIRRLLECTSIDEQRAFYERSWNNRRWRFLFQALLNRWVFHRAYDPSFFRQVHNPSFSNHFHGLAEHVLTNLPIRTNYFLHHMLSGAYPVGVAGGVPPYLATESRADSAGLLDRLELVDGSYTDCLRRAPAQSVHGYALSNICEWLTPPEIDALFAEIVRTAAPRARLVFRNFVGWNEVPDRFKDVVIEDRARGETLIAKDRSAVQRRIAVCRIAGVGR
jgi:S-adenosylmethionine-diacylglycerol 3-amino-3-carboxypropyl transferase